MFVPQNINSCCLGFLLVQFNRFSNFCVFSTKFSLLILFVLSHFFVVVFESHESICFLLVSTWDKNYFIYSVCVLLILIYVFVFAGFLCWLGAIYNSCRPLVIQALSSNVSWNSIIETLELPLMLLSETALQSCSH